MAYYIVLGFLSATGALSIFFFNSGACKLEGYVPAPPEIRQVDEGEVFVNWIDAASEKVDITQYELKYWKKDSKEGRQILAIEDLHTNFAKVTVEHGAVYSFQLLVKTSACLKWFESKISHFQTNLNKGVNIYVAKEEESRYIKRKYVVTTEPIKLLSVTTIVNLAAVVIGLLFFIVSAMLCFKYHTSICGFGCRGKKEETGTVEEVEEHALQDIENGDGNDQDTNNDNGITLDGASKESSKKETEDEVPPQIDENENP